MRYLRDSLIIVAAFWVFSLAGFLFEEVGYRAVAVWPVAGLGIFVFHAFGGRVFFPVWIGFWIALLQVDITASRLEPLLALTSAVAAWLGALSLRWIGFRPTMDRIQEVFLLLAAALPAGLVSSLGMSLVLPFDRWAASEMSLSHFLAWWAGDVFGVLVFGSVLFVWKRLPGWNLEMRLELIALIVGVLAVGSMTFFQVHHEWQDQLQLSFIIFPFLVWSGIRFGPHGSTLVLLVLSVLAVIGSIQGFGLFQTASQLDLFWMLQTYLLCVCVTGIVLSSSSTEQDKYGAMLSEKNRQLREAVEKAEKAAAQAKLADEAKSRFFAMMSHELRTPLTGVIGFTNLLFETPVNESQREYLRLARESGESLLHLIDDLLDFNRLDVGHFELRERLFRPKEVCRDVFAMFKRQAQEKGLSYELSIDEDLPARLFGDSQRLRQVLINLISNAIKFTEQGFVKVELRVLSRSVEEDLWQIEAAVSDTGIGIDPSTRYDVFDPFAQAHEGISARFGGSGLGLAVSRGICRRMGGDVTYKSDLGKGSRFSAHFQMKGSSHASHPEKLAKRDKGVQGKGNRSQSNLRILLVEDNAVNRKVMEQFLGKLGYHADLAVSGEEALRMAEKNGYDLILMDIRMPGIDGCETTRRIRAGECGERNQRARIIAVTAFAGGEERERCLREGVDGHMAKPITLSKLSHLLADVRQS